MDLNPGLFNFIISEVLREAKIWLMIYKRVENELLWKFKRDSKGGTGRKVKKRERDSIFVAVLNRWVFGAESWFQSKALGLWVTWGGLRGSCLALVRNMQARPE